MPKGRWQTAERSTLRIKAKSLPKQALHDTHYSIKRNFGKLTNMLINNEFNKLQINETIEKDGNGNVFKRSLMFNIRCNDVEEADKLYRQLKAKFNGNPGTGSEGKSKATANSRNNNVPTCECGRPMVLRNGKRGVFYGCSGFPQCRKTKQVPEVTEEEAAEMQAEEVIAVF